MAKNDDQFREMLMRATYAELTAMKQRLEDAMVFRFASETNTPAPAVLPMKRVGRPPGSKNKPQTPPPEATNA